ncbi:MAG: hypothetical protein QXT45_05460 [Candidatus Bilamarchaeaceae archaeon]
MAVLGQITVNEISVFEIDAVPTTTSGAVAAPIGSLAIMTDGQGVYQKVGTADTDWVLRTYNNTYANIKYHYRVNGIASNSTVNYNTVGTLETANLPIGLYEFKALVQYTAAATTTGIGIRLNISGGTYGFIRVLWSFTGNSTTNGSATMMWDRLQFNTTDNFVAPNSVTTANNIALAWGLVSVSSAGLPILQFRSEVGGSAVTILTDSVFWFDRIT